VSPSCEPFGISPIGGLIRRWPCRRWERCTHVLADDDLALFSDCNAEQLADTNGLFACTDSIESTGRLPVPVCILRMTTPAHCRRYRSESLPGSSSPRHPHNRAWSHAINHGRYVDLRHHDAPLCRAHASPRYCGAFQSVWKNDLYLMPVLVSPMQHNAVWLKTAIFDQAVPVIHNYAAHH